MTKLIETFPDGTTVERDLTEQELAQIESDKITEAERVARLEAKATAKAALLAQLGITEEQAKLLLS